MRGGENHRGRRIPYRCYPDLLLFSRQLAADRQHFLTRQTDDAAVFLNGYVTGAEHCKEHLHVFRNGDQLFVEIEIIFEKDLGISFDCKIEMYARVNNYHRRAEICRIFDALNDLLESLCRLILLYVA